MNPFGTTWPVVVMEADKFSRIAIMHTLRRRRMRTSAAAQGSFSRVGEETGSEDFRGDVCP